MSNAQKEKILLFWSGGKNSALAFHYLKNQSNFEIVGLVTILSKDNNLVPFHGIPDTLIIDQAKMLGLPLQRIFVSSNCTNEEYSESVGKILAMFAKRGIKHVAFGDIGQIEIRNTKEDMFKQIGMTTVFPLWEKNSLELAQEFLSSGHKALVTSVLLDKLETSFLALEFDQAWINRLPAEIDPCAMNGEFHTFVTYGPHFKSRVQFSKAIANNEGPYLVSSVKEP